MFTTQTHHFQSSERFNGFPLSTLSWTEGRLIYQVSPVEVLAARTFEYFQSPESPKEQRYLRDILSIVEEDEQDMFVNSFRAKLEHLEDAERMGILVNLKRLAGDTVMRDVQLELDLLRKVVESLPPHTRGDERIEEKQSFFEQTGDALEHAADWVLPEKMSKRLTRKKKIALLTAGTAGAALAGYALYRGAKWLFGRGKDSKHAAHDAAEKTKGGFLKKSLVYGAVGVGAFFGIKWLIEYADKKFSLGIMKQIGEFNKQIADRGRAGLATAKDAAQRVKGMFNPDHPWEKYDGLTQDKYEEAVKMYLEDGRNQVGEFLSSIPSLSQEVREQILADIEEWLKPVPIKHENETFTYKRTVDAFMVYERNIENAFIDLGKWANEREYLLWSAGLAVGLKTKLPFILANTTLGTAEKSAQTASHLGSLAKDHPIVAFFMLSSGILGVGALVKNRNDVWLPKDLSELTRVLQKGGASLVHPIDAVEIPKETINQLTEAARKVKGLTADVSAWLVEQLATLSNSLDDVISDLIKSTKADYVLAQHEESFGVLEGEIQKKINTHKDGRNIALKTNCETALQLLTEYKQLYAEYVLMRMDPQYAEGAQENNTADMQIEMEDKMNALLAALTAPGVRFQAQLNKDSGMIEWCDSENTRTLSLAVDPSVSDPEELMARAQEIDYGQITGETALRAIVAKLGQMATETGEKGPAELLGSESLAIAFNGLTYIVQGWRTGDAPQYFVAPIDLLVPGGVNHLFDEEGNTERRNWKAWEVQFGAGIATATVMTLSIAATEKIVRRLPFGLGGGALPFRGRKGAVAAKHFALNVIKFNPITSPVHLVTRRIPRIARDTRVYLNVGNYLPNEQGKRPTLIRRRSMGNYTNNLLRKLQVRPEELTAIINPRTRHGTLLWLADRFKASSHLESDTVGAIKLRSTQVSNMLLDPFHRLSYGTTSDVVTKTEKASEVWEKLVKNGDEAYNVIGDGSVLPSTKGDTRKYLEAVVKAMLGERKADAYLVILKLPKLSTCEHGEELARSLAGEDNFITELKGSKKAIIDKLVSNPRLARAFGERPMTFRRFVDLYKEGDRIDADIIIRDIQNPNSALRYESPATGAPSRSPATSSPLLEEKPDSPKKAAKTQKPEPPPESGKREEGAMKKHPGTEEPHQQTRQSKAPSETAPKPAKSVKAPKKTSSRQSSRFTGPHTDGASLEPKGSVTPKKAGSIVPETRPTSTVPGVTPEVEPPPKVVPKAVQAVEAGETAKDFSKVVGRLDDGTDVTLGRLFELADGNDDALRALRHWDEAGDHAKIASFVNDAGDTSTAVAKIGTIGRAAQVLSAVGFAGDVFAIAFAGYQAYQTSELRKNTPEGRLREQYGGRYDYHALEAGVGGVGLVAGVVGIAAAGTTAGAIAAPVALATLPVSLSVAALYERHKHHEDLMREVEDWKREQDPHQLLSGIRTLGIGEAAGIETDILMKDKRNLLYYAIVAGNPLLGPIAMLDATKEQRLEKAEEIAEQYKKMIQAIVEEFIQHTGIIQVPLTVQDPGANKPRELHPDEIAYYDDCKKIYEDAMQHYLWEVGFQAVLPGGRQKERIGFVLRDAVAYARLQHDRFAQDNIHRIVLDTSNVPAVQTVFPDESLPLKEQAHAYQKESDRQAIAIMLSDALTSVAQGKEQEGKNRIKVKVSQILQTRVLPHILGFRAKVLETNFTEWRDVHRLWIDGGRAQWTQMHTLSIISRLLEREADDLVASVMRTAGTAGNVSNEDMIEGLWNNLAASEMQINSYLQNPKARWEDLENDDKRLAHVQEFSKRQAELAEAEAHIDEVRLKVDRYARQKRIPGGRSRQQFDNRKRIASATLKDYERSLKEHPKWLKENPL